MTKRGRPPKTPPLSVLEHIPAIRDALRALGLEMVIQSVRTLGPIKTVYVPAQISEETMRASEAKPGDIILNTPERQEWAMQQQEVAAAIQAERALTNPIPKQATLPAAQRAAIKKGLLLEHQAERASKLSQFKHDTNGKDEPILQAETEQLHSLSEAT